MAVAIALAIPYAVLGPNFLLDDWWTLYFREQDGVVWSGGRGQLRARPGAWLVFLVQYGLIGAHPLLLYLLQTLVVAAVAVLIFVAARRHTKSGVAGAIALTWVLLPTHSTLDRWAACLPILVSLLLLLVGVVLLQRAVDAGSSPWPAIATFVGSALCYEATLPVSGVAVLAVPWLCGRRLSIRQFVAAETTLAATGVWLLANSQHARNEEFQGWFDIAAAYPANFGSGLTTVTWVAAALSLVAAIGLTVILARRVFPSLAGVAPESTRLAVAGLTLIVLGYVAFVRYPIAPLGLGDRANVVAAVGAAVVWVAIGLAVWRWRPAVGRVVAAAFLLVLLAGHLQRDVDYDRAGEDTLAILDAYERTLPSRPAGTVVIGPRPVFHHGIIGLIGTIDHVVYVRTGDRNLRARVALAEAEFNDTAPALRLDLRDVLRR